MARRAVSPNAGEIELVDRRSRYGKLFQQPDGKFRAVSSVTPQHWDDQGAWVEADDTPVSTDGGKTWTTVSTPYVLAWNAETLTLTYQSKKGGDVKVRLAALNGVPFSGKPSAATFSGQDLVFTVAPQLDIRLRVRTHGVEIYKILNGPLAPTAITWEVVEGDLSNIIFDPLSTSGLDNLNRSLARQTADGLNRVRRIELLHDKSVVDLVANPGKKTYTVTETFTGRTQFIDPITMARSFVSEVEYPVLIDISVTIIADLDDGFSSTAPVWNPAVTSIRSGNAYSNTTFGAWRFQTVAVPQGATINSATLTWNQTAHGGSATLTLAGNNVDSAASWANGSANSAATMAATTATASNLTSGANGTVVTTVTSIIQEIVNRAGWASNNHMRLGHSAIASGTGYIYAEDYSAAGTAQATLAITFTAAAAGAGAVIGPTRTTSKYRGAPAQRFAFRHPVTPIPVTEIPTAAIASAGAAAATFTTQSSAAAPFSAAGVATATFATASSASAPFSSAGVSTATFNAQSSAAVAFASAGAATATFTTQSGAQSQLAAAGVATATFTTQSSAATPFAIAGVATATFSTQASASAAFTMSGTATAIFTATTGAAPSSTEAFMAGSATANFAAASLAPSAFTVSGQATVLFRARAVTANQRPYLKWGKRPPTHETYDEEILALSHAMGSYLIDMVEGRYVSKSTIKLGKKAH